MSWYREVYLKSEDWKNLRAAVLALFAPHGTCARCGECHRLDVHHIKYRRLFNVSIKDLIPLCRACHNEYHLLQDNNMALHASKLWKIFLKSGRANQSSVELYRLRLGLHKLLIHKNNPEQLWQLKELDHQIQDKQAAIIVLDKSQVTRK